MAAELPRRIIKVRAFISIASSSAHFAVQETQRLLADPVPGISAQPDEKNARFFKVIIAGPEQVRVRRTRVQTRI